MKICSFLPSATEIVYALGLGNQLVGVSHECDFPPEARQKPRVVTTTIKQNETSSAEIDQRVQTCLRTGESLYQLDLSRLRELQPDVVITQELCQVCAIDASQVLNQLRDLPHQPKIISLHPHTLAEALEDIRIIGQEIGQLEAATTFIKTLTQRVERVRSFVEDVPNQPRVFCLEWLEPPMACGHWVPEMVEMAGGIEVLGRAGEQSRYVTWPEIVEAKPEVIVLMPCGFPIERTKRELSIVTSRPEWRDLPAVRNGQVYVVDGPAYFNCSGPRLIDGIELLAGLLHPDRCRDLIPQGSAERLGSP